ncbi:uncharacterized membrane protein HdeD (DUF308 family) [Wenyingzhuangia heitensis]|uniref:Uncharacterized membrane protein HdeD (DUF308 family) n=1 Tax=Wenyingzhuangia heitensis TaxID=1487859 RepID=A0ABX0U989_9FLAO|nr:DUF4293 domain-containing protein [Wenyingzhuangia heitensis]NIJ45409.1 uncharacterized membrane protein HdeD (DUF308 family) [Wenyingzhuangia heitensis]
MIQRIQTVYLFVAFIVAGVLTNLFSFFLLSDNVSFYLVDTFVSSSVLLKSVGVFFVLSAILSLVAIFNYKKRQNQFVVGRVNILINFYLLSVLMYVSLKLPGEMHISEKGVGIYFPIVIIVLLVMANKAIKKDEDLVKSVDRLR